MTKNRYLIATAFLAGGLITLGIAATGTPPEAPPVLCATEDSVDCYWDADTQGNGEGNDVDNGVPVIEEEPTPEDVVIVTPTEEEVVEEAPAVEEEVTPEAEQSAPIVEVQAPTAPDPLVMTQWETDTLDCGVNAKPAIDQDPHGNWWAYCEPALVD